MKIPRAATASQGSSAKLADPGASRAGAAGPGHKIAKTTPCNVGLALLAALVPCCAREQREEKRSAVTRPQPGLIPAYRRALACSAELCAACASLAEMVAVSSLVPQLGASLPSPHLRGR